MGGFYSAANMAVMALHRELTKTVPQYKVVLVKKGERLEPQSVVVISKRK